MLKITNGNFTILGNAHQYYKSYISSNLSSVNKYFSMILQPYRCYSDFSHVTSSGKVNMVDVGHKAVTKRTAQASARVVLGEKVFHLLKDNQLDKKGDVIATAKLAGILAAKNTHSMIPLCHSIPLTHINIDTHFDQSTHSVLLSSTVKCHGQTGVEMEALVAVSIAALTVYDMCKSVSHNIKITDVQLDRKSGGKSHDYVRS